MDYSEGTICDIYLMYRIPGFIQQERRCCRAQLLLHAGLWELVGVLLIERTASMGMRNARLESRGWLVNAPDLVMLDLAYVVVNISSPNKKGRRETLGLGTWMDKLTRATCTVCDRGVYDGTNTAHLGHITEFYTVINIFQAICNQDLYDLYDLAHVAGMEAIKSA